MTRNLAIAAALFSAATFAACEETEYDTVVVSGDGTVFMREPGAISPDEHYYVESTCGEDEVVATDNQVRTRFADGGVLTVDVQDDSCVVYVHDGVRTIRTDGSEHLLVELPSGVTLDRIDAEELRVHGRGNGTVSIGAIYADTTSIEADGQTEVDVAYVETHSTGMSLAGTARVMLEELRSDRWDVYMRGSSTAYAAGEVGDVYVDVAGNTELDAQDVITENVYGDVRGNATVRLTVLDDVDLDVRGNALIDLIQ